MLHDKTYAQFLVVSLSTKQNVNNFYQCNMSNLYRIMLNWYKQVVAISVFCRRSFQEIFKYKDNA